MNDDHEEAPPQKPLVSHPMAAEGAREVPSFDDEGGLGRLSVLMAVF